MTRMLVKSIRWQIQLWHSALLLALVVTLTVGFYTYEKRSRMQAVDARLQEFLTPVLPTITGRGPGNSPPGPRERRPPPEGALNPGGKAGMRDHRGPGGRPPENDPMRERVERDAQFIYYATWSAAGRQLLVSTNAPPQIPVPAEDDRPSAYRTRGDFREYIHSVPNGDVVVMGISIAPLNAQLNRLALGLSGVGALVLVIGIAGGWWLAHRAIRPISQISAAAENIAGGRLAERINVNETESELGALAATLNRTFDRLEENFEQQVRFTADASHELRTPIAVMMAEIQRVLLRERSPEEYRQALVVCERSVERMRSLVNALLELARYDSGESALQREDCDLARIARESLEFITPFARQRNAVLSDVLKSVPANVDAMKMGQVINNLLANAIVHNQEGVQVKLTVAQRNNEAVISVADNGAGIPADALPHLFERFFRVEKSRARSQGGSGLGLSICKAIVAAHGGDIQVVSEQGRGTTFTVSLPAGP